MVTSRDRALFEAGIKLGALYHQFTGAPVNLDSAASLEKAIQESISLQPFVEGLEVNIDRDKIASRLNIYGYCELSGEMLNVSLVINFEGVRAKVALKFDSESGYPFMCVEDVTEGVQVSPS